MIADRKRAGSISPALPEGYSLEDLGGSAVRLMCAGTPLVAVALPPDEAGRRRVRDCLARAARHRVRMQECRSGAIVAARKGELVTERELVEEACHARESYDTAIANALGRYSR